MKFILTDNEIEFAREFARKRHEAKNIFIKNTGILTNIYKKTLVEEYIYHKSHKPHFLGLLGEIAYAKFVGKKIDTNIYKIRDMGFDVDNVEIKTSTWKGSNIELKIKKNEFESKYPLKYVLVRVDENIFNIVELIGEISRDDFNKFKTLKQYKLNNPINYVVGVNHLTRFS